MEHITGNYTGEHIQEKGGLMKKNQQGRLGKKGEPRITNCASVKEKSQKYLLNLATRRPLSPDQKISRN